jgi:uncharacterized protein YggU (UPF0235/DUF167 family)
MRGIRNAMIVGTLGLALLACGGPGQTIPFSVSAESAQAPAKVPSSLKIAVVPFADMRTEMATIGRWQHYVETRVDQLVPAHGSAADQITEFVAEYLTRAGFQVIRVKPGETVPSGSADAILTGQIESYWNEAVAKFFHTKLETKNRLRITVSNTSDSSTVDSVVDGQDTSKEVFFDLTDLEQLNSSVLGESVSRFLASVIVVDRSLKARK